MKLNCKQGDIAIIVSSTCGNEGKIVQCLELLETDRLVDVNGNVFRYVGGGRYVWRIDRPINFKSVRDSYITQVMYCADAKLRPLRGDINDEELDTTKQNETETI